jgi:hypothetical protein
MKWYGWSLIGILVAGIIALYFYDLSTVNHLKGRITALEAHRDTFYVEGTIDTILIKKTYRDTLIAYKQQPIDTTIIMGEHTVGLATKDSLLFIDLECRKPELIITKTDTLYKERIKYVDKIEYKTDWEKVGYAATGGLLVGAIITLLLGGK